ILLANFYRAKRAAAALGKRRLKRRLTKQKKRKISCGFNCKDKNQNNGNPRASLQTFLNGWLHCATGGGMKPSLGYSPLFFCIDFFPPVATHAVAGTQSLIPTSLENSLHFYSLSIDGGNVRGKKTEVFNIYRKTRHNAYLTPKGVHLCRLSFFYKY